MDNVPGQTNNRVIDFRVRPPYGGFVSLGIFDKSALGSYSRKGVAPSRAFLESSMELFIEEMDNGGPTVCVIVGREAGEPYGKVPNADVASLLEQYPDRFIGFGSIRYDSIANGVADVKAAAEEFRFSGVATDPGWLDPARKPDDRTLYPVYAACEEYELPIIVGASAFIGPDVSFTDPACIQRVARDFPDLQIVVAHAGWPSVLGLLGACFTTRNIWLAPDFYGHVPDMPGKEHYAEAIRYFMSERTLYASAYPARPLGESIAEFWDVGLDDVIARRVLCENALSLLNHRVPREVLVRLGSGEGAK